MLYMFQNNGFSGFWSIMRRPGSACPKAPTIRLWKTIQKSIILNRGYAKTPYTSPATSPSRISDADVVAARKYCSNLLQKFDSPSYILQTFIPPFSRDAYLSIRALNVELARIADLVSNPTVGALRMQFWRDNINRTFANAPPKEPVAILLHNAIVLLREQHPTISTAVMKAWFMKIIAARETYMDNRPYTSLEALENYSENTYSSLMYLTLAFLPLHSLSLDHLASHVGKATGIAAVLRGLPLIAFPPPPNHHSNNGQLGGNISVNPAGKNGAVLLPLDIMAEAGVKEEEVFRQGGSAKGLKDAVFRVATRANDHLITAVEMMKNLKQGKAAGHEYEYEGEEGHNYPVSSTTEHTQSEEIERGFGVLMQSVATRLWLQRLEQADFDIFKPELRSREWKLPWKAYWAYHRKHL